MKAILHTNGLEYEDCSVDNKEFELWQNIYHLIDGEEALIARENDDEYTLISLINPDENKKFHWLLGQDAELGSYINDYKHFEDDWDNGNYSFDSFIILNKQNVELIHERGK